MASGMIVVAFFSLLCSSIPLVSKRLRLLRDVLFFCLLIFIEATILSENLHNDPSLRCWLGDRLAQSKETNSVVKVDLPIRDHRFECRIFPDPKTGVEHLSLSLGVLSDEQHVLTRVHSECITGDLFGSQRCDCGHQLESAIERIINNGSGLIIYLRQEGRGIGLVNKLKAYQLQDQGYDTVEANLLLGHQADERNYSVLTAIFGELDVKSVNLITNNPKKIAAVNDAGVVVNRRVIVRPSIHQYNLAYLHTKAKKMSHFLSVDEA